MKLRDPRLIAAAGWCGTRLVKLLSASLHFEFRSLSPVPADPFQSPEAGAFIFTLWHENFLIPIVRFGHPGAACLVSQHADGQLLAPLIRATGMGIIRGSTNRGGVAAVRQLLRHKEAAYHLAVTPDGPRGPRRQVQPGVVYLASRTGMRIVPVGVGQQRPWRLKSWDSFAIPRPFSRVRCLFGFPIIIPAQLPLAELKPHIQRLQMELDQLTELAQHWADTNQLDTNQLTCDTTSTRPSIVKQPVSTAEVVAGVSRESGD
jgi:lysophospholipid acyltransferase (LPLAT)-like uncharacterized protein